MEQQLLSDKNMRLSQHRLVIPVISRSLKKRALNSMNRQIADMAAKNHRRIYTVSYYSSWRSPMHYTKILCSNCYQEIKSEMYSNGLGHTYRKRYHLQCAKDLNIV